MLNFENFDFGSVDDTEEFVSEIFDLVGLNYSKADPICKLEIRRLLEEYTDNLTDVVENKKNEALDDIKYKLQDIVDEL